MAFITDRIVGMNSSKPSLSGRARARRWEEFMRRFPDLNQMKVLDLGGTPGFWRAAGAQPAHVTLVNLQDEACPEGWMTLKVQDACTVDLGDEHFDLVVSNSLLEHVGGHYRREQVVDVVRSRAPRHWIQTPYRYFPIEPHWVAPLIQHLPIAARARYTRRWPIGNRHPARGDEVACVLEVELLSISEMRHYFPESEVWIERFAGLPKSLVAVKD